jgi:hypothetical protein
MTSNVARISDKTAKTYNQDAWETLAIQAATKVYSDNRGATRRLRLRVVPSLSAWRKAEIGLMSVGVFDRAPGQLS